MKPNIFNYATSELTQDAVLCWIADWFNYEDDLMKSFSLEFISKIMKLHSYECDLSDLIKVKIERQYKKIDVFLLLYFKKGEALPIIIEDKTYTVMHDDQLKTYYQTITNDNAGDLMVKKPLGIYYKTGFIYDYEIKDVENNNYRIFTKEMMIELMEKYIDKVKSEIFHNYYEFLKEMVLKEATIKKIINEDDMVNIDEALNTHEGQWLLMKEMFREYKEGELYHGSSFGRPWTQFCILDNFKFKELPDAIFYRIDWRIEGYYISIRQYMDFSTEKCKKYFENTIASEIIERKNERLKRLKQCFYNTLEQLKTNENEVLNKGTISNRGSKESEIGVFFINEENTFKRIIHFISVFNKYFEQEVYKEFNITI